MGQADGTSPDAEPAGRATRVERQRSPDLLRERVARTEAEAAQAAALEETERRYRFLIDSIPQQVWTGLPDGSLDFVNEKVVEYFERPAGAIIGDGWQDVIHPDDLPGVVERWTHSLTTGDDYEVEFRLLRPTGAYRWHLGRAQAQRDPDGQIVRWFGTNTDLHDLKEAEAGRDRMHRELTRSNEDLDRFAYVASHDLKAPLRGIANLAAWIRTDLGDTASEETAHHLDLLEGRCQRLEGLIDGLLHYSRAGRAGRSVEPVDGAALLRDVIDLLDTGSGAQVEIDGELPNFRVEKALLEQVFLNLISNAIQYSDKETPVIRVAARPAERTGFHEFSVADDGPGIAERYHDRIWEIFQTLQSRDKVESTGIGLAVVKKIVEAQGGEVGIESEEGAGATFRFTWPTT